MLQDIVTRIQSLPCRNSQPPTEASPSCHSTIVFVHVTDSPRSCHCGNRTSKRLAVLVGIPGERVECTGIEIPSFHFRLCRLSQRRVSSQDKLLDSQYTRSSPFSFQTRPSTRPQPPWLNNTLSLTPRLGCSDWTGCLSRCTSIPVWPLRVGTCRGSTPALCARGRLLVDARDRRAIPRQEILWLAAGAVTSAWLSWAAGPLSRS